MTKDEILNNQALSQHMLFYSPLNKHAVFEKNGIHYEDQKPGVRILDYGKAEFNFPAVEAESVTVKGWGGSMPGEHALHRLEILRRLLMRKAAASSWSPMTRRRRSPPTWSCG